jgi:septation ring formation regulator EzrA
MYIYLDVDKRASERALGMLQFCHLALKTNEEQGVLAEQRKNLDAIQSTAGDIRALVDKLPPEEKQKAREIVAQMSSALDKQGRIVGDYLSKSDEQQKALKEHTAAVEKGLSSLSTDLGALKSLPATLKDIGDGMRKLDGKVTGQDADVKALGDKLADLDGKLQKLLARPSCEPTRTSSPASATSTPPAKPAAIASKPPADLGTAKP